MRWLYSLILLACATVAFAQGPGDAMPSKDIRLEEKKFEQLSNKEISPRGAKALAIAPAKWKHAETDHFIIHYRRATEAQKVVREIEFTLWYVAKFLGATKEQYAKKSHVYVFQDLNEWSQFRSEVEVPSWFASFAHGDELFLHVGGMGEGFDSETLAHETTHAVVARLYHGRQWPRWLNEGFAEYMGSASTAARKGVWTQGMQRNLTDATISPKELIAMKDYPKNKDDESKERREVRHFYQSSEKLVRFLITNYPKELFPRFIDAIVGGSEFEVALQQAYGDQFKDFATFNRQYEKFTK